MSEPQVLASGSLMKRDIARFLSDLSEIKVGEFVFLEKGEHDGEWVAIALIGNELLPHEVTKNLLRASLKTGELNRLGWSSVIQVAE